MFFDLENDFIVLKTFGIQELHTSSNFIIPFRCRIFATFFLKNENYVSIFERN